MQLLPPSLKNYSAVKIQNTYCIERGNYYGQGRFIEEAF